MTSTASILADVRPDGRDVYRFGDGDRISLRPGTGGWRAADLDDGEIRLLWDDGRYEIIEGVLRIMPAARFRGGSVVFNLTFLLRSYFAGRGIPAEFAGEVDIAVRPDRVLRADAAVVFGEDLPRFSRQTVPKPGTNWRDYSLSSPPSLVIESVSEGHREHDHRLKRQWYAEFGIPHYWIVDAYALTLDVLVLRDGAYVDDSINRTADSLNVASFAELNVNLNNLWPS